MGNRREEILFFQIFSLSLTNVLDSKNICATIKARCNGTAKKLKFRKTAFRYRFRLKIFRDGPGIFFETKQKFNLLPEKHETRDAIF